MPTNRGRVESDLIYELTKGFMKSIDVSPLQSKRTWSSGIPFAGTWQETPSRPSLGRTHYVEHSKFIGAFDQL